jgi:hypothetical protein
MTSFLCGFPILSLQDPFLSENENDNNFKYIKNYKSYENYSRNKNESRTKTYGKVNFFIIVVNFLV